MNRWLHKGTFRLARVAGVDVFLHWSWFAVAALQLGLLPSEYRSLGWNVAQYLTLFLIVLLHELGHVLACRSVGGKADRIVLWPLGGIAFVSPPPRPGALLWSIAAGPLVNLLLVPPTVGLVLLRPGPWWVPGPTDPERFAFMLALINLGLLLLNLLPIYPLDGGQIVLALLWFVVGRWRGLLAVSLVGLAAGASGLLLALFARAWLPAALAAFVTYYSCASARHAVAGLRKPRHPGLACPRCGEAPLAGPHWACDECGSAFDTFTDCGTCPACGATYPATQCLNCQQASPLGDWAAPNPAEAR
jgi:Zn-dependent protease